SRGTEAFLWDGPAIATHMSFPKRYLVRFGPKRTQHQFTDLLIIGGGIAGLRAALAAPPSMQVLVVTKDRVQQSNSTYAQGGIAAVRSPEDRFEDHIEDTLIAGAGLCDREVVDIVVRDAPYRIDDLIRYGAQFDPDAGMEGGHSYKRIVHALGAPHRAGADLPDMEVMQFHPTVLYVAGSSRYLISEAVRGFGAYLRDKDGHRFMLDVDPRAELATRDIVAQAIVRTMDRTQHP